MTVHLKVWKLSTSLAETLSVLTPPAVETQLESTADQVPVPMFSTSHVIEETSVSCTLPRKNLAMARRVLSLFDESKVLPSGVSICTV